MLYVCLSNLFESIEKVLDLIESNPDAYKAFLGAKFPSDLDKISRKISEFLDDLES